MTIIVLPFFLLEGTVSLSQNSLFPPMQMQMIPSPEPLFVGFLWILQQPHIARRAGVRLSSRSRYTEELDTGACVRACPAVDGIQVLVHSR